MEMQVGWPDLLLTIGFEGWVKTRFCLWLEPVTAAFVDTVTFLKASTVCSHSL